MPSPAHRPRTVLHLLTRPADPLTARIIATQQAANADTIEVADLTAPTVDYPGLVKRIFAADSIAVW